jgi:hypothetical protein
MKETAPFWSIRGRITYIHSEKIPGPGTYSPSSSTLQSSPRYRLGTSQRAPLSPNPKTPGPGAYSFVLGAETPSWTLYSLRSLGKPCLPSALSIPLTPGPGAYQPSLTSGSPQYSVGHSQRSPLENTEQTPGPGAYNPKLLLSRTNNV